MKILGITQRVENFYNKNERRDCLDQRWSLLADEIGYIPIPLSNYKSENIPKLAEQIKFDAIILSGGNSISSFNNDASDNAPERDSFELALIKEAIKFKVPVLGICRGMQLINVFFEGKISPVKGHINTYHNLKINSKYQTLISETVNSFHNWGIRHSDLGSNLIPIANDEQGNIEAFVHKNISIAGIMWHPEREMPFKQNDIKLIKKFI